MKAVVKPGKYVAAVSGGIDSMVLLDLLCHMPIDITVAHFDHGIRPDSHLDAQLVQAVAVRHGLRYEVGQGRLGPDASEAQARQARYEFLEAVRQRAGAEAIILAHHQDDVLETIILALLRGTGRKGLSSLRSTTDRLRPLIEYTKSELKEYARLHNLEWREDVTNSDQRYKRNYVRKTFMEQMTAAQRQQLLAMWRTMQRKNDAIDTLLDDLVPVDGIVVRQMFIMLPHAVACEAMAEYLRRHNVRNLSRALVERLVVAIKVARPHTMHDVDSGWILDVDKKTCRLVPRTSRKSH